MSESFQTSKIKKGRHDGASTRYYFKGLQQPTTSHANHQVELHSGVQIQQCYRGVELNQRSTLHSVCSLNYERNCLVIQFAGYRVVTCTRS